MKTKYPWQLTRSGIARSDGERRWDYAYQFLLHWAMECDTGNSPVPSAHPQEDDHGNCPVCSGLDQPPAADPDHSQPQAHWTLAVLAAQVGLSRTAFATKFRQLMGETPLRYITGGRLTKAAAYLRTGTWKLTEIARLVGYDSEVALSKAFKRNFGVAPDAYQHTDTLRVPGALAGWMSADRDGWSCVLAGVHRPRRYHQKGDTDEHDTQSSPDSRLPRRSGQEEYQRLVRYQPRRL